MKLPGPFRVLNSQFNGTPTRIIVNRHPLKNENIIVHTYNLEYAELITTLLNQEWESKRPRIHVTDDPTVFKDDHNVPRYVSFEVENSLNPDICECCGEKILVSGIQDVFPLVDGEEICYCTVCARPF